MTTATIEPVKALPKYVKLGDYERNGYDDSDFFDVVYDPETGSVFDIMTGSTRFGGPGAQYEPVPATPEYREAAAQYIGKQNALSALSNAVSLADRVEVGKDVVFKFGYYPRKAYRRTVEAGEKGIVEEMEGDRYDWHGAKYGHQLQRVKVRFADGQAVWVAASKLEVDTPANYTFAEPFETLQAKLIEQYTKAARGNLVSALRSGIYIALSGLTNAYLG